VDAHDAVAKHARAIERLRHTSESLSDIIDDIADSENRTKDAMARLSIVSSKLERLVSKVGLSVVDLE
tara:strand:- start:9249 stop:9452 length:204 start_codon:yes stop_codon:yes gene_type:complete